MMISLEVYVGSLRIRHVVLPILKLRLLERIVGCHYFSVTFLVININKSLTTTALSTFFNDTFLTRVNCILRVELKMLRHKYVNEIFKMHITSKWNYSVQHQLLWQLLSKLQYIFH